MSYTRRVLVRAAISLLFFYTGEMRFVFDDPTCIRAHGPISDLLDIHYYFNCGPCPFFAARRDARRLHICNNLLSYFFLPSRPSRPRERQNTSVFCHRAIAIRFAPKLSHFLTMLNFDATGYLAIILVQLLSIHRIYRSAFARVLSRARLMFRTYKKYSSV